MALKALGYSANSTNKKELNKAKQVLQKQKKHVYAYSVMLANETSLLNTGDVYLTMAYSGDALMLKEINSEVEFLVPKEGGNLWIDFLTVSDSSKNKELAYRFINFLNEPAIAAQLAQFVACATPNAAAEKLLSDDFLQNPVIYPSEKSLKKSEIYKKLQPRIQKMRNNIYSNLIH